jgi:hypothetical protein
VSARRKSALGTFECEDELKSQRPSQDFGRIEV